MEAWLRKGPVVITTLWSAFYSTWNLYRKECRQLNLLFLHHERKKRLRYWQRAQLGCGSIHIPHFTPEGEICGWKLGTGKARTWPPESAASIHHSLVLKVLHSIRVHNAPGLSQGSVHPWTTRNLLFVHLRVISTHFQVIYETLGKLEIVQLVITFMVNGQVLERIGEKRTLLNNILRRKTN